MHKGQLKPPAVPLRKAFAQAMEAIDGSDCPVALFMVAGEVMATKKSSQAFENNVQRLASGLVGVYDEGADARSVLEDLRSFYEPRSLFPGVDIDKVHERYRRCDPLEILIRAEEKTCKGCAHKTKRSGVYYCDKPNGKSIPAGIRCEDYEETAT